MHSPRKGLFSEQRQKFSKKLQGAPIFKVQMEEDWKGGRLIRRAWEKQLTKQNRCEWYQGSYGRSYWNP